MRTPDTPLAPILYFRVATAHLDHSHYHLFSAAKLPFATAMATTRPPRPRRWYHLRCRSLAAYTSLLPWCPAPHTVQYPRSFHRQAGPDMEPAVLSNLMTTFAGPTLQVLPRDSDIRQEVHTRGISDLLEAATVHAPCKGAHTKIVLSPRASQFHVADQEHGLHNFCQVSSWHHRGRLAINGPRRPRYR